VFEKLELVLVLFKKTLKEVNVIFSFIINAGFISSCLFCQFI